MSARSDDLLARIALSCATEPGGRAVAAAVRSVGVDAAVWSLPRPGEALRQAEAALADCASKGMSVLGPDDVGWPTQLNDLANPPHVLYTLGQPLRPSLLRSVSIVGSRAATTSGLRIAHDWAARLSGSRFTVVSGAAFGIDAAAHRGALGAGGSTVAVLASGADVASPRAHQGLLAHVRHHGTIVSELPPGTAPSRHRFLVRNRLIAALTPATLVVQAAARSGALSTARQAAELHRLVLAIPGGVAEEAHAGCNALIRERVAELIASPHEAVALLLPLGEFADGLVAATAQVSSTAR